MGWSPGAYEWYFARTPLGSALRRADERLILPALDEVLSADQRVLEVGAGTGHYTGRIARAARSVVALEPSPAMRHHLVRRLAAEGLRAVEVADGALPDRLAVSERFDGVVCLGVLNYVADLEGSLRALGEVVRPGGWVLFSVPPASLEGRVHALVEALMRRRVFVNAPARAAAAARAAGLHPEVRGTSGVTRGGITHLLLARSPEARTRPGP